MPPPLPAMDHEPDGLLPDRAERLRLMLEQLPVALAILDRDGVVREISGHGLDAASRTPEEFLDRPASEIVRGDGAAGRTVERALAGEDASVTAEAAGVMWEARLRPLRDDTGTPVGVVVVAMDVTERLAADAARQAAELDAARKTARFEALVERSFEATAVIDRDAVVTYASANLLGVAGYQPDEAIGRSSFDFVHPDDLERMAATFDAAVRSAGEAPSVECRVLRKDGSATWVEAAVTNRLHDPAVRGIVLNLRDITERREMQAALEEREAHYRGIVETAQEGVWLVDPDAVTTFANRTMASMLGVTPADMVGVSMFEFLPPELEGFWQANLGKRRQGLAGRYEQRLRRADGSEFWVEVAASPLEDADGNLTAALAMVTDIDERKRAEVERSRMALHDDLTGLANRALLVDHLEQALDRTARWPGVVGVLFLDLDNFKFINDSVGHDAGDELLRAVAARLVATARPGDTVARLGGDEFVVVCEHLRDGTEAVLVADRLLESLEEPVQVEGTEVFVSASIGVAFSPAEHAAALLRNADTAMYRAKERGRARVETFDASLLEAATARFRLHSQLREAVSKGQLSVHYQPIVSLDEERVVGVEALVRWPHPEHGLIGPEVFIPIAEQAGLIRDIGQFVLDQACAQLVAWDAAGLPPLTLSVNLSVRHLAQHDVVHDVSAALERHQVDPGRLCLELTESALMDDARHALGALERLHASGVRFSIDDFGTGYSSLVYLRRFPIEEIKVDRSFISGLPEDLENHAIVANIVSLAAAVGARTVAEGVETAEQLESVVALGCDHGQGYVWHRPVPGDDLARYLAAGPSRTG